MFTLQEFADYTRLGTDEVDTAALDQLKREARVKILRAAPTLDSDDTDWPEAARVVAMRVVARGYLKPTADGAGMYGAASLSQNAGPFGQSVSFREESTLPGVWLTKEDLKDLGQYRRGDGGAYTVNLGPDWYTRGRGPNKWRPL